MALNVALGYTAKVPVNDKTRSVLVAQLSRVYLSWTLGCVHEAPDGFPYHNGVFVTALIPKAERHELAWVFWSSNVQPEHYASSPALRGLDSKQLDKLRSGAPRFDGVRLVIRAFDDEEADVGAETLFVPNEELLNGHIEVWKKQVLLSHDANTTTPIRPRTVLPALEFFASDVRVQASPAPNKAEADEEEHEEKKEAARSPPRLGGSARRFEDRSPSVSIGAVLRTFQQMLFPYRPAPGTAFKVPDVFPALAALRFCTRLQVNGPQLFVDVDERKGEKHPQAPDDPVFGGLCGRFFLCHTVGRATLLCSLFVNHVRTLLKHEFASVHMGTEALSRGRAGIAVQQMYLCSGTVNSDAEVTLMTTQANGQDVLQQVYNGESHTWIEVVLSGGNPPSFFLDFAPGTAFAVPPALFENADRLPILFVRTKVAKDKYHADRRVPFLADALDADVVPHEFTTSSDVVKALFAEVNVF